MDDTNRGMPPRRDEKGCVVWITGMPSAGKSTLAAGLRDRLRQQGTCCNVLDGDEVRAVLVPKPGYSPEARDAFYATLAGLAALLANDGAVAIVAATAHQRAFRDRARIVAPRFVEVLVDVSRDECARRDAKQLYAAARAGHARGVPGADLSYEPPVDPDVVARGGYDEAAIAAIIEHIRERVRRPT